LTSVGRQVDDPGKDASSWGYDTGCGGMCASDKMVKNMGQVLLFALLAFSMVFTVLEQEVPKGGPAAPAYYELYSWRQGKAGAWNFSVFYNTDRQKSVGEIFDNKTVLKGLDRLKLKISEMPRGSRIIWFDELTLAGVRVEGSEKLKSPPDKVVREIKRYAQEHGIEVVGPPKR
jgi:hypothetical protein